MRRRDAEGRVKMVPGRSRDLQIEQSVLADEVSGDTEILHRDIGTAFGDMPQRLDRGARAQQSYPGIILLNVNRRRIPRRRLHGQPPPLDLLERGKKRSIIPHDRGKGEGGVGLRIKSLDGALTEIRKARYKIDLSATQLFQSRLPARRGNILERHPEASLKEFGEIVVDALETVPRPHRKGRPCGIRSIANDLAPSQLGPLFRGQGNLDGRRSTSLCEQRHGIAQAQQHEVDPSPPFRKSNTLHCLTSILRAVTLS